MQDSPPSCGSSWASADASISTLTLACHSMIGKEGAVDTSSAKGIEAVVAFLQCIEKAGDGLGLSPADRSYRSSFTENYKSLFHDQSRNYMLDFLRVSLEQAAVMEVNGKSFVYSTGDLQLAKALKLSWERLCTGLSCWSWATPTLEELRKLLQTFDNAWASFEESHVNELMSIEARCKEPLLRAIHYEQQLQDLEGRGQPNRYFAQKKLLSCISALNSMVKNHEKGRGDLSIEVLWDAVRIIELCDKAEQDGHGPHSLSATRILCEDVVESFDALREYVRGVADGPELVDPELCNNADLADKLADWEESWEIGKLYVQDEQMLYGITDLITVMRLAEEMVPDFKRRRENCDVQFFMAFPRILWLRGLTRPASQEPVFKTLLPHHFESTMGMRSGQWNCDEDLKVFMQEFYTMTDIMCRSSADGISERRAMEVLVKRAVVGMNNWRQDPYAFLSPCARAQVEPEVEAFMEKLEDWCQELQRHQAEDWHRFVSVVTQCLSREEVHPGEDDIEWGPLGASE